MTDMDPTRRKALAALGGGLAMAGLGAACGEGIGQPAGAAGTTTGGPPVPPPVLRTPPGLDDALRVAAAAAPGRLGVTVIDLTNEAMSMLRPYEPFPMHSTVKLFVAAWAEAEIEAGRLDPDAPWTLERASLPGGSGRIDRALAAAATVQASAREMIEAMLVDSDNAATDWMIARAGGPLAIRDRLGLTSAITMARSLKQQYEDLGETAQSVAAWLADPRDKATPYTYAKALVRLGRGALAGPGPDSRVRAIMARSPLGADRLTRALGTDWRFAGRTGSGPEIEGRTTGWNHCGLATHVRTGRVVAIAAFLSDAGGDRLARDAALARVGQAVAAAWPDG